MPLQTMVDPDLVFFDVESRSLEALLRAIANRVAAAGAVASADRLYEKLAERETLGSTAMGHGIAIPHCKLTRVPRVILAVGRAAVALDLHAPDDEPVRTFFVLISPEKDPAAHLKGLGAISKWVQSTANLKRLGRVRSKEELVDCLRLDSADGR